MSELEIIFDEIVDPGYTQVHILNDIITPDNGYYKLGCFRWKIVKGGKPSDTFNNMLLHLMIINKKVINVPFRIKKEGNYVFKYIFFDSNKLNILDGIFLQGSKKIYINNRDHIYSEHVGSIISDDNEIKSVNIIARNGRIKMNDDELFMAPNIEKDEYTPYVFHTHPIPSDKRKTGVPFEVPSSNDILHFMYSNVNHGVIGHIVISAEGLYVIRSLFIDPDYEPFMKKKQVIYADLQSIIVSALVKEKNDCNKCIDYINKSIKKYDTMIEFYPRTKDDNLREFYLCYFREFRK